VVLQSTFSAKILQYLEAIFFDVKYSLIIMSMLFNYAKNLFNSFVQAREKD